jgi:hypothetical protein
MRQSGLETISMAWVEVREPHSNWLLFKYDPERAIIQVQRRGIVTLVDLKTYEQEQQDKQAITPNT